MSFDLQLWSVNTVPFLEHCPETISWKSSGDSLIYEQRSWQLSVVPALRVLPEDVPFEVARALPGIAYLTELNLSPINAPEAARKFARRTATAIAKASHGVVFDPQDNSLSLPSGVHRYLKPKSDENASVLKFSWWFVDGPVAANRYSDSLDALETVLPEGTPRRYGLFEPPQHVYAEEGREHFLRFLTDNARGLGIIWNPSAPVYEVSLKLPDSIGASKQGFRSGCLSIAIDLEALKQPGWQASLRRMWQMISTIVRPFYGDVRTLHRFRRHRGRLFSARDTMHHPVKVWWWPGIPPGPAHSIVLGKRYADLWPAFSAGAVLHSDLYFKDTADWTVNDDVYEIVGQPPLEIIRRDAVSVVPREYPLGWPFEPPRSAH